nr:hypothetical protein CFP56_58785 [Quercus suber]
MGRSRRMSTGAFSPEIHWVRARPHPGPTLWRRWCRSLALVKSLPWVSRSTDRCGRRCHGNGQLSKQSSAWETIAHDHAMSHGHSFDETRCSNRCGLICKTEK